MVGIKFPAYGSLYFVDSPLNSTSKQALNPRFCTGPHCGTIYWNCKVGGPRYYQNTTPNQEPWLDLTTYCDGIIDAALSRIPSFDPIIVTDRPITGLLRRTFVS
ncbi:uncharacterized protein BP5553_09920 [Venustampulla echinocandica]|uniref:Uncharacterized protein n=1 Tax=Venustampulla echinocandica TaxID=2656787 RepID=A0A370TB26_9HELO|nr:uncharacterized protein BP5553_09920 [Venustampulla echinocandica]RDL31131.1 hypothetical protein BP5553_09920 [Venustampulla echinocandica]